ncbi:hypothetical protein F8M41_020947 [Gigaspora margarita]|uniref:Uncharacterized protein n=1 Tax=Gigaspora margarita TaxID=4874 RepID=A0A8H4AHL2_GIGMA|nr:hypothetical protein F8M41_020947 [Gigaspora margarita]
MSVSNNYRKLIPRIDQVIISLFRLCKDTVEVFASESASTSASVSISTCSNCKNFETNLKAKAATLIPGYVNGLSFMANLEKFKKRYDQLEKKNESLLRKCNELEEELEEDEVEEDKAEEDEVEKDEVEED